jgi:hypothetical protein
MVSLLIENAQTKTGRIIRNEMWMRIGMPNIRPILIELPAIGWMLGVLNI